MENIVDFRFLYPFRWKANTTSFNKNGIKIKQRNTENFCSLTWNEYESIFYNTENESAIEIAEGSYSKGVGELTVLEFINHENTYKKK